MIRRREDERFSTPRATLGSSTASDSSEWGTPRERWSAYSDRESISPKPEQNMAPTPAPLHGGVGGSSSPFMAPAPAPLHGGAGNHSPFYTADVESVFSLARHNRYQDVERLLEKGVPVNVLDEYGNSILAVACQNGHKRVAKAALRRGADLESANYMGNTALHFCFKYGHVVLGQYLISKGADTTTRNALGQTCFEACED